MLGDPLKRTAAAALAACALVVWAGAEEPETGTISGRLSPAGPRDTLTNLEMGAGAVDRSLAGAAEDPARREAALRRELSGLERWLNTFERPRAQVRRLDERRFLAALDRLEASSRDDFPEVAREVAVLRREYLFRRNWDARWRDRPAVGPGDRPVMDGAVLVEVPVGP